MKGPFIGINLFLMAAESRKRQLNKMMLFDMDQYMEITSALTIVNCIVTIAGVLISFIEPISLIAAIIITAIRFALTQSIMGSIHDAIKFEIKEPMREGEEWMTYIGTRSWADDYTMNWLSQKLINKRIDMKDAIKNVFKYIYKMVKKVLTTILKLFTWLPESIIRKSVTWVNKTYTKMKRCADEMFMYTYQLRSLENGDLYPGEDSSQITQLMSTIEEGSAKSDSQTSLERRSSEGSSSVQYKLVEGEEQVTKYMKRKKIKWSVKGVACALVVTPSRLLYKGLEKTGKLLGQLLEKPRKLISYGWRKTKKFFQKNIWPYVVNYTYVPAKRFIVMCPVMASIISMKNG